MSAENLEQATWKDLHVIRQNNIIEYVRCIVSNNENGHDVVYVPFPVQYDPVNWRWMLFFRVEGEEARAEQVSIQRAQPVVIKRFQQHHYWNGVCESAALQAIHDMNSDERVKQMNQDLDILNLGHVKGSENGNDSTEQLHNNQHDHSKRKVAETTFRPPHRHILHYITTLLDDINKERYVITHYFAGSNLDFCNYQYCARVGQFLPAAKVREIVFQCIEALYIIHCQYGYAHQNFTGSNVLVGGNLDSHPEPALCKAADFECSIAPTDQGYSDFQEYLSYLEEKFAGSNSFNDLDMDAKPPEMFWSQYRCVPYHPQAADIWALGILTMKLMTGGHNFLALDFNANRVMMELSPWFQLLKENPEQFILNFASVQNNPDHELITMMTQMLCPYPAKRINISQLYGSKHRNTGGKA